MHPLVEKRHRTGNFDDSIELATFGHMRNENARAHEVARRLLATYAAPGGAWDIRDVSHTGYRLVAPMSVINSVTLGTLVAIRAHGQSLWTLGIVRRMKRLTSERAEIGLQVIANNLVGVELFEQKRGDADYSVDGVVPTVSGRRFPGLFLSLRRRDSESTIQTLIVPAGEYQPGKRMQMSVAQGLAADRVRAPARAAAGMDLGDDRIAGQRGTRRRRDSRLKPRARMTADRYRELCARHRWNVPQDFNIAAAVCGRHADDRSRIRDVLGRRIRRDRDAEFWDLQQQANRLPNALAALGVGRGDKVAIMLPQRPETAIAHIACYQLGAVAVPLVVPVRPRCARIPAAEFGNRRRHRRPGIVAQPRADPRPAARPAPCDRRRRRPRIVAARLGRGCCKRPRASFSPVATRATDPALLVYTSGTTGPPKGALMPQQCLLGNLPGFVYSHDQFPQAGRRVLVAGGLGLDRRPDGRAAADAVFRLPGRRLPRPLRSRAGARADREIPGAQYVPVSDRAQDDDEGDCRSRASATT